MLFSKQFLFLAGLLFIAFLISLWATQTHTTLHDQPAGEQIPQIKTHASKTDESTTTTPKASPADSDTRPSHEQDGSGAMKRIEEEPGLWPAERNQYAFVVAETG